MPSQPQKALSFRFSTQDLPVRDRRNAVCELRERGLLPIEPLADRAPQVEITKWFLPGAAILAGSLCGVRQQGQPGSGEGGDDLFFGVNLAGRSAVLQRGREIALADGDATLVSLAAGAFTIARPMPGEFVGLRVPRKAIAPLVSGLDDPAMRLIPGATDTLRLLTGYIRAMLRSHALNSPEISQVAVTHLHDLIALSLGTIIGKGVTRPVPGVRAARLQAIKSDIAASMADGTLPVADVAARHGMTPRYVHKLFESEGVTYSHFVLRQRLDRAFRMLRDQRFAGRSISSIAYEVGFDDLSYFNRSFRRQFNATPSDVRNYGRN